MFWDVTPFTSVEKRRYLRKIHLHNLSKLNETKKKNCLAQLFF